MAESYCSEPGRPAGRSYIDLGGLGGPGWSGFRFGRYGKAKEWRLITPDGAALHPGELVTVRHDQRDVDYLQTRVKDLERRLAGSTMSFGSDETQLIRVALQILLREVPVQLGVRDARIKVPGLRVAGA